MIGFVNSGPPLRWRGLFKKPVDVSHVRFVEVARGAKGLGIAQDRPTATAPWPDVVAMKSPVMKGSATGFTTPPAGDPDPLALPGVKPPVGISHRA